MGRYQTDSFARIMCKLCGNKVLDILMPGQPFDSIKICPCETKTPVNVATRVTPVGTTKIQDDAIKSFVKEETQTKANKIENGNPNAALSLINQPKEIIITDADLEELDQEALRQLCKERNIKFDRRTKAPFLRKKLKGV